MGYITYSCQMGHLLHMGYDVYIMIYGLYNVFVSDGTLDVCGSSGASHACDHIWDVWVVGHLVGIFLSSRGVM